MEREEAVEGIIGIAAPIRDYTRRVIAALGVALTIGQSGLNEGVEHIAILVKKHCDDISSDLGYLRI
jgi:DNA-binding IclR family transcriptional regulator